MSVNKFCINCDSLLFPREDIANKTLLWACHECPYQEPAQSNVTYEKVLDKGNDMTVDPILPRTRNARCPSCGHKEAKFFKAKAGCELTASLFFVCCKCTHQWQERPQDCDFVN